MEGSRDSCYKSSEKQKNYFENVGKNKSTSYLKTGFYKFLSKYPTLTKFTLSYNYFQKNLKAIKIVCKNNVKLFS